MSEDSSLKFNEKDAQFRKGYLYTLVLNAALGSFFFGFTLAVFNPVQEYVKKYVYTDISETILYLATSFVPAGAAIGAVTAGSMSKQYGRRNSMLIIDTLSLFGVGLELLPSEYFLLAGRLLCGFCVGLNSSLVPIYISEVSPVMVKGTTGTFNQIFLSTGVFIAFLLGLGLPQDDSDSNWWRLMLGFPIITSGIRIILLLCVFREETPRYSISSDKDEDALKALQKIYKGDYPEQLFDSLKRERENESSNRKPTYRDLFSPRLRRRFYVGVGLQLLQQLSGVNGITFYSDTIFEQQSGGDAKLAQLYTAIIGIVSLTLAFSSSYIISKIGRKSILSYGCILLAINYTIFIWASYESNGTSGILKYCIWAYSAVFGCTLGPVVWIYCAEILPDIGVGASALVNWMSAFVIAQGFPYLLNYFGQAWAFSVFGVSCYLGIIFCFVFLKETKGKTEQEIAHLFSKNQKIEDSSTIFMNSSEASENFLTNSEVIHQ